MSYLQDLSKIDASYACKANVLYSKEKVVEKFVGCLYYYEEETKEAITRTVLKERRDLTDEFKRAWLSQPVSKNHKISYYPVYYYETDTTKKWVSTGVDIDYINSKDGTPLGNITTTTTYHNTKSGITGVSDFKCKELYPFRGLRGVQIDKKNVTYMWGFEKESLSIYKEGLFFSKSENRTNGLAAGRRAAGATSGQKTTTSYKTNVIFVPILTYEFEYQGKKCSFEMDLHSGETRCDGIECGRKKEYVAIEDKLNKIKQYLIYGNFAIIPVFFIFALILTGGQFGDIFNIIIGLIFLGGAGYLCYRCYDWDLSSFKFYDLEQDRNKKIFKSVRGPFSRIGLYILATIVLSFLGSGIMFG